eukprot:SRR837773.20009.p2 GENE.SRR837773.20009~~SRR837773.20009.p2  ORF type:complete len:317 (-),score=181.91 SRR837773.20009:107-967(-)
MNANRATLAEQAAKEGMTGVTAVTKKASEVWKTMSDADKAPWEKKFKDAQAAYEAYKNSDGFVAPEKKQKRGKGDDKKKVKDPEAPKKPVGGAYGMFSNEKRDEFVKKCEAKGEKGFGAVAKMTSEAFKLLTDAQKKPYADKFTKAMEEYKVAMAAYKEKKAAAGETVEEDDAEASSPSPVKGKAKASPKASAKKRTAGEAEGAPAAKAGRGAAKAKAKGKAAEAGPALPAAVLAAAEKEGLRASLENLAKRPDVQAKGCEPAKLLEALRSHGGLVNKAKAAVLGA